MPLVTAISEVPARFHWGRARPLTKVSVPDGMSPEEVANCMVGMGPMAWLDGECPGGWRGTLLAHNPELELTGWLGSPSDRQRLRELAAADAPPADSGTAGADSRGAGARRSFPDRMVIGAIEFDGRFWFGRFTQALWHDRFRGEWYGSVELADKVRRRLARKGGTQAAPSLRFVECIGAGEFGSMVRKAQEWIASGDIYQVNLARKYLADWPQDCEGAELALFQRMRRISPAPHASFLDLGPGRRKVLSVSPETFMKFAGRQVETQPIKGTRPRARNRQEDLRLAAELMTCPKERAELIMITDLLRNDLGQVCEFGSIRVPELLQLKRFSHVQHLISTVSGRLREGLDAWDVLAACSPGGSISGAPKRRALEVIAEIEKHARGLYTGSIGWLDGRGQGEFSIAIRSLVIESGQAHFHVGAGLVADSLADREFQETCHKAAGLLQACSRQG